MNGLISINNQEMRIKEWNGQRVVTFKDIDKVHVRVEGTAHRNFKANKTHLIENLDYYIIKPSDIQKDENRPLGFDSENPSNRGTVYLTEMGYLMIVKSLNDDLAWNVQRQLVTTYFKAKEFIETVQSENNNLVVQEQELNEMIDTLSTCAAIFQNMIDYTTINYKQQQALLMLAKSKVSVLLGGAHSDFYREHSRVYFKNLWMNFCENFSCGTYKDLNPIYIDLAKDFIRNWRFAR